MELPKNLLPDEASPEWMNKGNNAWQLTAATLVGLQSIPGLVILYGSLVKSKWAVNSAFMAFYAFAAVLDRLLGRVGLPDVVRRRASPLLRETGSGVG
jgi:Amt family ammonium transporter